jgi:hypothetical protein
MYFYGKILNHRHGFIGQYKSDSNEQLYFASVMPLEMGNCYNVSLPNTKFLWFFN